MSENALMKEVAFGIEAETFLLTPIGKHLVACAEAEAQQAINALKLVDASNVDEVRSLQARIWRAESVQTWIAEIIQAGWNAERIIAQVENET